MVVCWQSTGWVKWRRITWPFKESRPLQSRRVVWWASPMRMTVAVCLSQWQSSITRWRGRWLSKTSLPPTRSILVYVWSFIFSTSAFYCSCVSFQFIGPVTGRCGHVTTSHPFWQRLPAAVVITHTLWNTLDVIMGTTGAGRPAATATVCCVQWRTVTLILSQGVGSERKKYRETYMRNKVLDQLYWLIDILDQLFRYLQVHLNKLECHGKVHLFQ